MMGMETIFGVGAQTTMHLEWWQECARAVLIFAYGFILLRLTGRRIFGKWAALDIIVSIIIGSNLSRALTGQAPLGGTLLSTTLLIALHWLLAPRPVHPGRQSFWKARWSSWRAMGLENRQPSFGKQLARQI